MEERKNSKHLVILFSVLLFGGLWGIIEATLGTLFHSPVIKDTMFLCSTTILVPIAYFLMGACYKRTGTFRSVLYMGLFASAIKTISCLIFHMSFNPVFYMLLEASMMGVALLVIRPKEVLSFKGLGTFIIANTLYLLVATFIRLDVTRSTASMVMDNITHYALTLNCVAILYTFAAGAILYGIKVLAVKYNWNFDGIKKVIYHPAFASSMAAVALVLTIVIR